MATGDQKSRRPSAPPLELATSVWRSRVTRRRPSRALSTGSAARRDLPWRRTRDPYAVWVSETMLQQTRVEHGRALLRAVSARSFPRSATWRRRPRSACSRLWSGLGYYRRARMLHAAAKEVAAAHAGVVPSEVDDLRRLRGVGAYTAGAVASIAFGRRAAVVDGNVARVLARLFAIEDDVKTARGSARLWRLAERARPRRRRGSRRLEPGAHGARRDGLRPARARSAPAARRRPSARGESRGSPSAFRGVAPKQSAHPRAARRHRPGLEPRRAPRPAPGRCAVRRALGAPERGRRARRARVAARGGRADAGARGRRGARALAPQDARRGRSRPPRKAPAVAAAGQPTTTRSSASPSRTSPPARRRRSRGRCLRWPASARRYKVALTHAPAVALVAFFGSRPCRRGDRARRLGRPCGRARRASPRVRTTPLALPSPRPGRSPTMP